MDRQIPRKILLGTGISLVSLGFSLTAYSQDAIFLDPDVEYIPDVSDDGLDDLSDEDRTDLEEGYNIDVSRLESTPPEAPVQPATLGEPVSASLKGETLPERHY